MDMLQLGKMSHSESASLSQLIGKELREPPQAWGKAGGMDSISCCLFLSNFNGISVFNHCRLI